MTKNLLILSLLITLCGCFGINNSSGKSGSGSSVTGSGVITEVQTSKDNFITITEEEGVTTQNYPIQIGRPFLTGEIRDYPQAVVNGTPVETQSDIKERYLDGSVKHAVLNFLIPTLSAGAKITVRFQNQSSGNNSPLSQSDMLDSKYNFDAKIDLNNGSVTASAKSILTNNDFSYWLKGSVATSVILVDHSENRKYDMGFDSYKSFRPIFHATFWPKINKVRVRYIGEISNTETLQNMNYSLTLYIGNDQIKVYEKPSVTHYAMSRWTKESWIGGSPSKISIDHNLQYLSATKFIPNYDSSRIVNSSIIANDYSAWGTKSKDLYDAGMWMKAMFGTGGRPDIGMYPAWTVKWLYTGDWREKEIAFAHADLAGAWPMHLREGKADKYFNRNKSVKGLGKVLSLTNRTTLKAGGWNDWYTASGDKITPVGAMSTGGWEADLAHQPDAFSPQYMLSGDFWYLEEMYFWASYSAAMVNYDSRGPDNSTRYYGALNSALQTRAEAWVFRNRIHTAFLAPDNTDEKEYFTTLTEDAIAYWEGVKDIKDTKYYNTPQYKYGVQRRGDFYKMGLSPLHMWHTGSEFRPGADDGVADGSITKNLEAPWMVNFLIMSLGRGEELGYETAALKKWAGQSLIGQITSPDYDPYLTNAYRYPTIRVSDGKWFDTWSDVKKGMNQDKVKSAKTDFLGGTGIGDVEHGYPNIAMAAASYIADLSGGGEAWSFIDKNVASNALLNNNPKWAIKPRKILTGAK